MQRYAYAFRFEVQGDETWLRIPKLSGLISALPTSDFKAMPRKDVQQFVTDAAITELQAIVASRAEVPAGDERLGPEDAGLVVLSVQQAVKLELFKLYRNEFRSVAELSRHLDKVETSVRRMLDLRHPSSVAEVEQTIENLGRRLVVSWDTEAVGPSKHTARPSRAGGAMVVERATEAA